MKADDIPSECIEDPRFIKVLAASLCSEIAESKIILNETNEKIQEFKETVSKSGQKRKQLKQSVQELSEQEQVLIAALDSLMREGKNRSIEIEKAKNRLDDATLREIEDRAKFEKILENYRVTWQRYKVEYQELPLAMEKQQCCISLKQLTVQRMIIEYKKDELEKMMRQREKIDAMRIRVSIVDLTEMIMQRWKDDKYLDNLKSITREIGEQLKMYTRQLSDVQQEVKRKRLDEYNDMAKMPPPRLDFPFMRTIIYPSADERTSSQHQGSSTILNYRGTKNLRDDTDTVSVNTLMLEEMCAEDDYDNNDASRKSHRVEKVRETFRTEAPVDSMTIQQSDSPRSVKETTVTPNSTMIDKSTDKIRNKLQVLDIEKNQVSIARYQEELSRQQRNMTNIRSKKSTNDGGESDREMNDRVDDIHRDSSVRRNVNWYEEWAQKKLASPYALAAQVRPRLRRSNDSSSKKRRVQIIDGDFGDYEGVSKNLKDRNRAVASLTMEFSDKTIVEKKRDERDEDVGGIVGARVEKEITIDRAEESPKRCSRRQDIAVLKETRSSPIVTARQTRNNDITEVEASKNRPRIFNSPTTSEPSFTKDRNDYTEMLVDNCENMSFTSRNTPKRTRFENDDRSSPFMTMERVHADKGDNKQTSSQSNLPFSPYHPYVPSCVSSDNLSTIAEEHWPETHRGENRIITDFPTLQNWENWSPPRQNSEMSFSPSSYVDKDKNMKNPKNHEEVESQEQHFTDKPNENSQLDVFFKATVQKSRNAYL